MKPLPHTETLTYTGKKGETHTLQRRMYCVFRVEDVSASDSGGGEHVRVGPIFVGNVMQVQEKDIDTCRKILTEGFLAKDLSLTTLGLKCFNTCQKLLDISIRVTFLEDAEVTVTLKGRAFKEPGDDRETMKHRAIDEYVKVQVRSCPTCMSEPKFLAMIKSMRESTI